MSKPFKKRSYADKVREHAEALLKPLWGRARPRGESLAAFKQFLRKENLRLRLRHNAGEAGVVVAESRAFLLDVLIENIYRSHLPPGLDAGTVPVALVATGGYGRGQLNTGSDIDLQFLHTGADDSLSAGTADLISEINLHLFDLNLDILPVTRSIGGAIRQANIDSKTKTSLIEVRLICGNAGLFEDFKKRFHEKCVAGREDEYLATRLEDLRVRHKKFGNTVNLKEPNVKSGCGGLRDYQTLKWIAYFKIGTTDLRRLVEEELLTWSDSRKLERAYSFLMRVRNDLHYQKSSDLMTLHLQGVVADHFGYPGRDVLRRSAAFMREYYLHTRDIFTLTKSVLKRLDLVLQERRQTGLVSFLAFRRPKIEKFDGFYSKDGLLYPETDDVFADRPARLMRLFHHAQLRHLELSPQIERLIGENLRRIDTTFQYRKKHRETFEAILSRKGMVGPALRQMHNTGVLGRYLPEFGELTCLVQHEFFHQFSADEHTLQCIEKLDELSDTDDPAFRLYQELFHDGDDPYILYLALVLHDTGRASQARFHADASTLLADKVARRLQIEGDRRKRLLFLVENHLLLYKRATTMSIEDPATVADFAAVVRSRRWLDNLLLLTFADSRGTSADSWNGFKALSIEQLYRGTRRHLEGDRAGAGEFEEIKAARKAEVEAKLGGGFEEEIGAHFQHMPERYFRNFDAGRIARHLRLFREFFLNLQNRPNAVLLPVFHWKAYPEQGFSEVLVLCWDRDFLLARIAGAFASRNINILSADIYTRKDHLVLNVFRVCTTNFTPVMSKRDTRLFEETLGKAIADPEYDLSADIEEGRKRLRGTYMPADEWLFPLRVYVTNDFSADFTFVEIQALDRLGLLYDIFGAISNLGYRIVHSRISTEKGAAIDSFYLAAPTGGKIEDPKALRELDRTLREKINTWKH